MVQQILDPSGALQHVILSPDPMLSQQTHPPPPQQQSHHGGVPITPYVSIIFNEAIAIEGHHSIVQLLKALEKLVSKRHTREIPVPLMHTAVVFSQPFHFKKFQSNSNSMSIYGQFYCIQHFASTLPLCLLCQHKYRVFKKVLCVKSLSFYYYESFDRKLKSMSNEA